MHLVAGKRLRRGGRHGDSDRRRRRRWARGYQATAGNQKYRQKWGDKEKEREAGAQRAGQYRILWLVNEANIVTRATNSKVQIQWLGLSTARLFVVQGTERKLPQH
jgi:hypothetical protein